MSTIDRLQDVMVRLGPVDDEIIAIVQIDDATWVVRYENLDVEVAFDRAWSSVALQADVGFVEPAGRGELYAAMMQYNLLQRDTGGIVLAATADHTAVQMLDLGSGDLDEQVLEAVLTNFVSKARVWRSLVAGREVVEAEAPLDYGEGMFTIRG